MTEALTFLFEAEEFRAILGIANHYLPRGIATRSSAFPAEPPDTHKAFTIRTEGHIPRLVRMALERDDFLTCVGIPHFHGAFMRSSGHETFRIRAEGDVIYRGCGPLDCGKLTAGLCVPYLHLSSGN